MMLNLSSEGWEEEGHQALQIGSRASAKAWSAWDMTSCQYGLIVRCMLRTWRMVSYEFFLYCDVGQVTH